MIKQKVKQINDMLEKHDYKNAYVNLVECIKGKSGIIDKEELIRIIVNLYVKSNNAELAVKLYNRALKLRSFDSTLRLKIYNGLAKTYFYKGEYEKTLCYLDLAQQQDSSPENKIYIISNKARVLLKMGSIKKAVGCLERSLNLASLMKNRVEICRSCLSLALCTSLLYNEKRANNFIKKIDVDYLKENYPFDHCVYYEYKGHIEFLRALNTGDKSYIKKALKTLHYALKLAVDFTVDGTCEGQTCRLLAEVYLHQKEYEKAREYATRSFRISRLINERYEVGVTYWIFGKLAEIDNDPKRAEFNYHMSRKILTDIGAKYELERLHETPVSVE